MKTVLLITAALLVAIAAVSRSRGRVAYEQRLAALQAAGAPICEGDLARLYPDPPLEKDFRQFLRSLLPPGSAPSDDPPWVSSTNWSVLRGLSHEQPVPPDLLEAIHAEYATNQAVLDLLLRTDLRDFGFAEHWARYGFMNNRQTDGDTPFQRFQICMTLACLAAAETEAGHPGRASLALVRGMQVARLPARTATSFVLELCCENTTLLAINRALARGEFGEPELAALAGALPRRRDGLRENLLWERAWTIWLFEQGSATMSRPGFLGVGTPQVFSKPLLAQAHLRMQYVIRGYGGRMEMLDRCEERIHALDLPVAAQLRVIGLGWTNFQQKFGTYMKSATHTRALWDLDFRLRALMEPNYLPRYQENALIQAQLANAQAVVAIERWRLAHPGQWPERLAHLVPAYLRAVPLDPFADEPVRFRRLPQGYVVYCVGLDFTDDGGKAGGRGENPGTDTTLRVLR